MVQLTTEPVEQPGGGVKQAYGLDQLPLDKPGRLMQKADGLYFVPDDDPVDGLVAILDDTFLGSDQSQSLARSAIRKTSGFTHVTSPNSWTLLVFDGRIMTGVFLDASNVVTTVHSHLLQIERFDGVWVTLAEA